MPDKQLRMRMAKASEDDLRAAMTLCSILEDLDRGDVPRQVTNGEPVARDDVEFFDEDDRDHLHALYAGVKACLDAAPGGLFRVVYGMAVLLDPHNAIVDPDDDALELHPRFEAATKPCRTDAEFVRALALADTVTPAPADAHAALLILRAEIHRLTGHPATTRCAVRSVSDLPLCPIGALPA